MALRMNTAQDARHVVLRVRQPVARARILEPLQDLGANEKQAHEGSLSGTLEPSLIDLALRHVLSNRSVL
jgi:hypothetical protein